MHQPAVGPCCESFIASDVVLMLVVVVAFCAAAKSINRDRHSSNKVLRRSHSSCQFNLALPPEDEQLKCERVKQKARERERAFDAEKEEENEQKPLE